MVTNVLPGPGLAVHGGPRIALTTEWLTAFGGAERCLVEFQRVFPDAPIYTSVYEPRGLPAEHRGWAVRPSFLQRVPLARRNHRPFFPLMPLAFESFDLSEYDLVLTTSSAAAKGVITPPDVPNLCYCYTPPRYLWDQYHQQTKGLRGKAFIGLAAHWLRVWDRAAADRVDHFLAISETVASRIRRYYRREATVVHPPVDTQRFRPNGLPSEDFLLVVSRLVPYKRVDQAVIAATRLGVPLKVVGVGPEMQRLRALAGRNVTFLGWRDDAEVAELYARCRAFVFPGLDDFGIAPVEAMASGRPVVAYGRGGATETVIDGVTGILYDEQTDAALAGAIEELMSRSFDAAACRAQAERFDSSIFRTRIAGAVADALGARPRDAELPSAVVASSGVLSFG